MNLKQFILLGFCHIIVSCKSNFVGKELEYKSDNDSVFQIAFVNDSILEISSNNKSDNMEKATYKYDFLEKYILERIKENQPPVNFKTKKLYGQFYQNIALELISGESKYFKENDTLNYMKMRSDGKMIKRIYFDNGNKFIEL